MATQILIIEDNPDVRENMAELLELSNYDIITAENGKEGVKKAKEELPDLIICDIMMPELDGYGVLQILTKQPQTARIPFIFLTAKGEKEDFRKGMALGADDYLTKPFHETDLLDSIENRLRKHEMFKQEFEQSESGLNDFISLAKDQANIESLTENKKIRQYKAKEILFREGDIPNNIFFINKGKVKVYKMNEDGKEYITTLVGDGEFFGITAVLSNTEYQEWAETIEKTEIIPIPKDELFDLLYSNRDVATNFIRILANNISEREEQLLSLAYDTVRKRVADALVSEAKNQTPDGRGNITINFRREHLAQVVGTATETTIRILSDLKKDDIIRTEGSKIVITDMKELESIRF